MFYVKSQKYFIFEYFLSKKLSYLLKQQDYKRNTAFAIRIKVSQKDVEKLGHFLVLLRTSIPCLKRGPQG